MGLVEYTSIYVHTQICYIDIHVNNFDGVWDLRNRPQSEVWRGRSGFSVRDTKRWNWEREWRNLSERERQSPKTSLPSEQEEVEQWKCHLWSQQSNPPFIGLHSHDPHQAMWVIMTPLELKGRAYLKGRILLHCVITNSEKYGPLPSNGVAWVVHRGAVYRGIPYHGGMNHGVSLGRLPTLPPVHMLPRWWLRCGFPKSCLLDCQASRALRCP